MIVAWSFDLLETGPSYLGGWRWQMADRKVAVATQTSRAQSTMQTIEATDNLFFYFGNLYGV